MNPSDNLPRTTPRTMKQTGPSQINVLLDAETIASFKEIAEDHGFVYHGQGAVGKFAAAVIEQIVEEADTTE